jgi:CubicO group peptidase (beta-lactamase class C family)
MCEVFMSYSSGKLEPERNADIERALIHAMDEYQVPGLSIAILHEYSIVWSRAYGVQQADEPAPIQVDTLFQACSISKAVTAAAVMRLVQEETLDLDEDVNRYLKTWKIPANDTWQPVVTLRQLLSHTAGINVPWFYGYHREQDIPSLLQILTGEKPANTPGIRVSMLPGTRFRYSGGGYCVLQQLLCDVRSQSFPELMLELVFERTGMIHSTFEQPLPEKYWHDASYGHRAGGKPLPGGWHTMPEMAAAGLWTTAADLAAFSIDLQLALAGQTGRLLSPEMAGIFLSPQIQRDRAVFMGLGVWLEGQGRSMRFGHPGDNEGFASHWTASREGGTGAVILTNSDTGAELIAEVLDTIAEVYGWTEIEEPPPSSGMNPTLAYVGTYRFQSGALCTVLQKTDSLYIQMSRQPPIPLKPASATAYILEPLEGEVIFLVDREGSAHGLLLRQDGTELEATKVNPGNASD